MRPVLSPKPLPFVLGAKPREVAMTWRKSTVAERRELEADIAAADAWHQFRWSDDGTLIARQTTEEKLARRGADASITPFTKRVQQEGRL